ncbi:polysaccharide deacetylase family protein [Streptomyces gilvosporeus]|uniref:NodB homology domain-containing protein n=1 Tax=Streptomyces gilvosporeus TaxID=553510 RepID=A0A1V0TSG1_9ACTN|nr:polysaccharide deacetylase family protein [Streptomyces gilvosporeus]ARF55876.1 hypothetical protein B1H19_18300 [Streptomyces gilvosporeus]
MQIVRFFRTGAVRGTAVHAGTDEGAATGAAARARGLAALSVLGMLAAGCGVHGEDLLDNVPAGPVVVAPDARALHSQARRMVDSHVRQVTAAQHYGLPGAPFSEPRPPAFKPFLRTEPKLARGDGEGLPAVITRVPTRAKVVFLTVDDGAAKDSAFVRVMRELDVPFTALTTSHGHPLDHLRPAEQRTAICRLQDALRGNGRERPRLFRPPFGAYSRDTLKMAAACGAKVVPLWNEEASPGKVAYREHDHRLHPGDIVLLRIDVHPGEHRPLLAAAALRALRTAHDQGFAVGRLEDYV